MVENRSLLLLSGGLDSTVAAYLASQSTNPQLALTFDYGQRAAKREIEAAGTVCLRLAVPSHKVMRLPWLAELTHTALVSHDIELPQLKADDLDDPEKGGHSAKEVWVPNRNGLFLNIAGCFAESLDIETVIVGFNAEEGATFPDNGAPFVGAVNDFFSYSTLKKVRLECPTLLWNKRQIAAKALELEIDLHDLWSCYEGGESPCRTCESCLRSLRAFREAGIVP